MRYLLPIALLFLLPFNGLSRETNSDTVKPKHVKSFNWGAKIGFNSILPVINSFVVDGVEIQNETRVEYKVGNMGAVFCRLNLDRFFIQPSLSLHKNESDIYFRLPEEPGAITPVFKGDMDKKLNLKIYSVDLPVMIGYNIVKEAPFGLSIMAGGKVKHNFNIRYTSNLDGYQEKYTSDDNPFRVNLVGGIGVTLWQLFFDFTYEVGINHRETDFKEVRTNEPLPNNIVLDKRLNMMSFSLGVLF